MPVNQRAPARVLTLPNQQFPPHTSVAQSPSTGNLQLSPLINATQVYAVDSQTVVSSLITVANSASATVTWPVVNFSGLLNPANRVYSGATVLPNQVVSNIVPLQVVPEVQLVLLTWVSNLVNSVGSGFIIGNITMPTSAIAGNTAINTMVGPFFPGSTTYTAFQAQPRSFVYNITGGMVTNATFTLTIQAMLVGVNLA